MTSQTANCCYLLPKADISVMLDHKYMEPVYCLSLLSAQSNHKMQPFQGKTVFSSMKRQTIQNQVEYKRCWGKA